MKIYRKQLWDFTVSDGTGITAHYHTDREEYLDDALKALGHILATSGTFNDSKPIEITIRGEGRKDDLELIEW